MRKSPTYHTDADFRWHSQLSEIPRVRYRRIVFTVDLRSTAQPSKPIRAFAARQPGSKANLPDTSLGWNQCSPSVLSPPQPGTSIHKFLFDLFERLVLGFRQFEPDHDEPDHAYNAVKPERSGSAQSAVQERKCVSQYEASGPKGKTLTAMAAPRIRLGKSRRELPR
jgi:hypothetical protein